LQYKDEEKKRGKNRGKDRKVTLCLNPTNKKKKIKP
jgi:hypothetical protein